MAVGRHIDECRPTVGGSTVAFPGGQFDSLGCQVNQEEGAQQGSDRVGDGGLGRVTTNRPLICREQQTEVLGWDI